MPTLQILIPQYNETEDVIRPLLSSVALQQGVDWESVSVIICNDGSDTLLSDSFLEVFPFKISYIKNEHYGVSRTRNTLLASATADYVMCCDADDMFIYSLALQRLFEVMEDRKPDIITSDLMIEMGKRNFISTIGDTEYVHGKLFRKEYLVSNSIGWYDPLIVSGDTYFLALALRLSENKVNISPGFYLYRWNEASICRGEKNHFAKNFLLKLISDDATILEFIKRGKLYDAAYFYLRMCLESYAMMNSTDWDRLADKGFKEEVMRFFISTYNKYKSVELFIKDEHKKELIGLVKKSYLTTRVDITMENAKQWLKVVSGE